jgi:hypothetical protein
MKINTLLLKKGQLMNSIVREVAEYKEFFDSPIPLKILSAKYNRRCLSLLKDSGGGFQDVMQELFIDGTLRKKINKGGLTMVYCVEPGA